MSHITERLEQVRPYWKKYWEGSVPMLCAVQPKNNDCPVPKPPIGITSTTDIDRIAEELLHWEESSLFLGGAIPFYCVYPFDVYNLVGVFLGGKVEECGDSHAMIPFVDDLDTISLRFNPEAPIARRLQSITARLREKCGDKILISSCAIGGNLDVLEAIRGSSRLLTDILDNPQGVHRCLEQIDTAVSQLLEFMAELYDFDTYGSICRHGMYSQGRVGVPQCDFGYMIGPKHFQEFAFPYLQREFDRLDGVCYHLDGIGNLPNLELLCSHPRLHIVQWVPGTGHDHEDWSWVREKIDSLGKGQILGGTVREFEKWYKNHTSPWQYWKIQGDNADVISSCLNNLAPGIESD